MIRVVAYVPDLMDRSKVSAAAAGPVTFVASPDELDDVGADADLVLADLGRPGVLDALARLVDGRGQPSVPPAPPDRPEVADRPQVPARPQVVVFGPHVDADALARARGVGCDRVLARSAFFAGLAELLA